MRYYNYYQPDNYLFKDYSFKMLRIHIHCTIFSETFTPAATLLLSRTSLSSYEKGFFIKK